MLLYLQNTNNENVFYLTGEDEFFVGRKDCNFLIQDDQSISRKHARIRLKDNKVFVVDCGSKYKTTHKGKNLEPNTEVEIAIGDVIQFGVSHSSYRLEKYDFVTTGTCLDIDTKNKLISDLSVINGKYVDLWRSDCTHLTVEEITLTAKFLHALLDDIPVVTPAYWSKFAERVRKQLPPPNINIYNKPQVPDVLLNKVHLGYNPKRKEIFKGKLFVFAKEKNKRHLGDFIKKAGGSCISWEKNVLPLEDFKKSTKDLLLIQTTDTINDPSYNKLINEFAKQGARTIPPQEIALAIILCSCETNCNPFVNTVEQVFPVRGPSKPTQGSALVNDTESEQFTIGEVEGAGKTEPVSVPDTFESNVDELEPCGIFMESEMIPEDEIKNSQSVKRSNDSALEENPFKRPKTDSFNVNNNKTEHEEADILISKRITKISRFKEDLSNKDDSKANLLDLMRNKRIETQSNLSASENGPFKRTKKGDDSSVQINKANPFLLPLSKRKRDVVDLLETSTSKKKRDDIFSSTKCENVSRNITGSSQISRICKDVRNSPCTSTTAPSAAEAESGIDLAMKEFIEQFNDTVIVETMAKIPEKPKIWLMVDCGGNGPNKKVNFKRFRKFIPLNPQTVKVDKGSFIAEDPENTTDIFDSRRDKFPNSDSEADEGRRVKKKGPKKFII